MRLEGIIMNHILQMLSKLLSVAKEAIDRQGLIAILTIPVNNNDEIEETAQGETVYNELIDQLRLNIPKIRIINLTSIVILVLRRILMTPYSWK